MFLATTAIEEFWDPGRRMLMLGEWCRRYSRRHVWLDIEHEVLPYPWDDRDAVRRAFVLTEEIYERQLVWLSNQLNRVHASSYDLRFWRIVLGPWLRYFIEILYERYTVLDAAARSGQVTAGWAGRVDEALFVPPDFGTLKDWSTGDEYNHYLYDRIIALRRHVPVASVSRSLPPPPPRIIVRSRRPRLAAAMNRVTRRLPRRLRPIVFDVAHFRPLEMAELQFRLGPFGCVKGQLVLADDGPVDRGVRAELRQDGTRDEFEDCLAALLPWSVPKVHLESFASMRRRASAHFPSNPEAIFTANAYSIDEGFKLWAASSVSAGTRLVIGQHGGHDGTGQFSSPESHEHRIADTYSAGDREAIA